MWKHRHNPELETNQPTVTQLGNARQNNAWISAEN